MGLNVSMSDKLPSLYETLADIKVSYNGNDIYAFYDDDYEVSSLKDKVLKVQKNDVPNLANGDIMNIDSVPSTVINYQPTRDGLEMIIGLREVQND